MVTWLYYRDLVREIWPEAEPVLKRDIDLISNYLKRHPERRNLSKDVPLVLGNYALIDVPNTITDEQVEQLFRIIEPSVSAATIRTRRRYCETWITQHLETTS